MDIEWTLFVGWLESFYNLIRADSLIKEWQTLIAGALALVGAWWTVGQLRRQMRADHKRHYRVLERKKMSVRAHLPDALSGVVNYVEKVIQNDLDSRKILLDPPDEEINVLKAAIEFVDDGAATRLFELVSWYQIWRVRYCDYNSEERFNLSDSLYDSCLLRSYADSIFSYARNEENDVPTTEISRDAMIRSLKFIVGVQRYARDESWFKEVRDRIERRHAKE